MLGDLDNTTTKTHDIQEAASYHKCSREPLSFGVWGQKREEDNICESLSTKQMSIADSCCIKLVSFVESFLGSRQQQEIFTVHYVLSPKSSTTVSSSSSDEEDWYYCRYHTGQPGAATPPGGTPNALKSVSGVGERHCT